MDTALIKCTIDGNVLHRCAQGRNYETMHVCHVVHDPTVRYCAVAFVIKYFYGANMILYLSYAYMYYAYMY